MIEQGSKRIAYTLKEAGPQVGMSERTVRRAWQDGELVFRERGGKYYVEHDELVRWVKSWPAAIPGRAS